MCKSVRILTLAAVFGLAFTTIAQAEQSVYVDLSALDELSGTSSPVINNQPLFPVVKAETRQAKPVKKKKAKPAAEKKTKVSIKVKEKVVIPAPIVAAEPAAPVVPTTPASPAAIVKEPVVEAAPLAPAEAIAMVENSAPAGETAETAATAPKAAHTGGMPVVPAANVSSAQDAPAVQNISVQEAASVPSPEQSSVRPVVPAVEPAVDEETITVVDVEPLTNRVDVVDVEPQSTVSSGTESPVSVEDKAAVQPDDIAVPGQFKFAPDSAELTVEQQAGLDALVNSFENPLVNKIAIYAFNLDDGVDSFRKKRLSLNRAIEIRSYLLQKGYKNFSIKVVNVDAGSEKANMVEVGELK